MRRLLPLLLALVALACGEGPTTRAWTDAGAVVSAPTPEARVEAAVRAAGRAGLGPGVVAKLDDLDGPVAVDGPELSGMPEGRATVDLLADPALRPLLLGTDEAALADALRERGVRAVVLHARAAAGMDRGAAVASRLYHHDHLLRFRLLRVGDDVLLYQVLARPLSFPPQLAGLATAYLRERLRGRAPGRIPDLAHEDDVDQWELVAVLRPPGGREAVSALARNRTFQGALEELVQDLERGWRRNVEPTGFPPLSEAVDDVSIEISRVIERAYVEPRDDERLAELWELGVDGAYLLSADRKERGVLPGYAAFTRSIREPDRFLREVAKQGRMSDRRPWRDRQAWLELLRTIDWRELERGVLQQTFRGTPLVPLDAVTVEAGRQAVLAAGDWYLHNIAPNGQVIYKFWPSENRYSDEYNLVRHTLATWNLVMAWDMDRERAEYLDAARRALGFTQQFLVREPVPGGSGETMALYEFRGNRKLGTVAVNVLGMVALARATGERRWDDQLREMGRFILHMQNEQGTFDGYDVPPDHPSYKAKNDIVPGEAALALVTLAEYFDDDSWIATLPRYWAYYDEGGWFRERAARADRTLPWPRWTYDNDTRLDLVQFGPWTVMAAEAYHRRTGDDRVARFGLEIARWMIETYQWDADRAPFPDYLGGYYKLPDELPAMQAFCYAEGTAAAYALALRAAPEEAGFFGEHTRQTVRFALQMQYGPESTYAFSRPLQVDGGIRYALNETKVRIDYVHHATSAVWQWVRAARSDPGLDPEVRDGPALPAQLRRAERRAEEFRAGLPYPVPVRPIAPPEKGRGAGR